MAYVNDLHNYCKGHLDGDWRLLAAAAGNEVALEQVKRLLSYQVLSKGLRSCTVSPTSIQWAVEAISCQSLCLLQHIASTWPRPSELRNYTAGEDVFFTIAWRESLRHLYRNGSITRVDANVLALQEEVKSVWPPVFSLPVSWRTIIDRYERRFMDLHTIRRLGHRPGAIRVATSPANANAGTYVDLVNTSNFLSIYTEPNGIFDLWETIRVNLDPVPVWGDEFSCDGSQIGAISPTAGLIPSNAIPTGGTLAWTTIYEDQYTGLLFTNRLYDGSENSDIGDIFLMCQGLNSGDGTGKWQVPTQKELMQLEINGLTLAGIENIDSTSGTYFSDQTRVHDMSDTTYHYPYVTSKTFFCVR